MVNLSPGLGIVPFGGSPTEPSSIRKYKTAATTFLKSGRVNELKKFNRTLSACSLPTSILQRIFIFCAHPPIITLNWTWVEITFVCSIWRQAALECDNLWSYIDFSHPKWTSLTLHRAQLLSISVRAIVKPHNQHTLQHVLQLAPRIHEIHLISSLYDIGSLIGTLGHPNHFIESLIVDIQQPEDVYDIRYSRRSLPPNGPPIPSLKYLELHRTPMNLVLQRYTGLTRLSLHHLPFFERPTRQEFFSLLKQFTMLEYLTLVRAFPKNIATGNLNSEHSVYFPKLISISLTGSIQELVNVLDYITLQPACRLHCHVDRMNDFKTNFPKLTNVIGSHFHDAAWMMPLDTLVIVGREESLRFTAKHELNPEFRQTLRIRAFGITEVAEPLLDFAIGPDTHTSHDEVIITAFASIWDALPLSYIHTLTLQSLDVITHKTWPRLLSSLRSLRVIDIGGHPPSGLTWALLLNARSHSRLEHKDISSVLLSKLEDIYIHHVDCFAGGLMVSSTPINSHCDLDDSRFLDVLLAYLQNRRRCNLGMRSLSISRCQNISTQMLNSLRENVSHLSWDNHGLFQESEELNSESPATYRSRWPSKSPTLKHYFRLRTLLELE